MPFKLHMTFILLSCLHYTGDFIPHKFSWQPLPHLYYSTNLAHASKYALIGPNHCLHACFTCKDDRLHLMGHFLLISNVGQVLLIDLSVLWGENSIYRKSMVHKIWAFIYALFCSSYNISSLWIQMILYPHSSRLVHWQWNNYIMHCLTYPIHTAQI